MREQARRNTYRWLTRVLTALIGLYALPMTVSAQDEPEYRLEVGAGAGTLTYLGDFNGNLLSGLRPWGTVMVKYKANPRMALGLSIGYGQIEGSQDGSDSWYPLERYTFNHHLMDIGLRYEYNFWPFGTGQEYRGARKLTPFIAIGLGATHYGGPESGLTANVPLGAGIKCKIATRLNLMAEWRMHFSLSDKIDGLSDPYGIKSSGIFKNTDCYSIIQMAITYDLWAKCKTCNNDRY